MNYKHFIMIALVLMLALAVPASAEWSNGNWIDSEHSEQYFGTAKVVTDAQTGVTSKYNPITSEIDLMTYQGHVYGNLKSGHVLDGGEVFLVSNDLAPNVTKKYTFTKDGLFDDYFAPGNYTITLPQGTGSAAGIYNDEIGWVGNLHAEVAHINVAAGQTTYFTFIGNSVPTPIADVSCADLEITSATYGAQATDCHNVPHDEIYTPVGHNHGDYDFVPAQAAYDEYVNVGQWHGDYNRDFWGNYYYIGHDLGKYDKIHHDAVAAHYEYVGWHHGDYTHTAAWDETVCDKSDHYVDVTDIVQDLVTCNGLTISADTPAYHYNALFGDPIVGTVKQLSVSYTLNGVTGSKTVGEHVDMVIP